MRSRPHLRLGEWLSGESVVWVDGLGQAEAGLSRWGDFGACWIAGEGSDSDAEEEPGRLAHGRSCYPTKKEVVGSTAVEAEEMSRRVVLRLTTLLVAHNMSAAGAEGKIDHLYRLSIGLGLPKYRGCLP